MAQRPVGEGIRIRGLVQGVGFRPTVWRLARECGLGGEVWNDGQGVEIRVWGSQQEIDLFCRRLRERAPPLSKIDRLERFSLGGVPAGGAFTIRASRGGKVRTGVVPDAALCAACRSEIDTPADRRYRYPFTNCTHCGPRLSIIERIPYDRGNTSMGRFTQCPDCLAEYEDPGDRRFHAQPNACPVCGPRVWLADNEGNGLEPRPGEDPTAAASRLLAQGRILAIKGIGGFHLACDAGDAEAVARLRARKGRDHKPFALMARDPEVIRRYCSLSPREETLLRESAAPILLLPRLPGGASLPEEVAPRRSSLGFMLPYTPLHHLLLQDWERPLVMTSGNRVEEPQCIDNREASDRLRPLADAFLLHDREILNRVDDSVVRMMGGEPRLLRRARGYAPAPIPLPEGFAGAPPLLALGGELKNCFCLTQGGEAILSQHLGDLENLVAYQDFLKNLRLYGELFQHRPVLLAADLHPNYRSSRHARELAGQQGLPLVRVQHHHAHIASVMAENGWPLTGGRVLGLALDGSGYGSDDTVWGGEFLLADYRDFRRLGWLRPVPLPGGTQAILQPWRNSFSQLRSALGWDEVKRRWGGLEAVRWLERQPLEVLEQMIEKGVNVPLSSSCGRLFDAVAALLGICRESISYEGQTAIELEEAALAGAEETGYPLAIAAREEGWQLDPASLWPPLLDDLAAGISPRRIAWRFHQGLAASLAEMTVALAAASGVEAVALSGGVFQNRTLFELLAGYLRGTGLELLTHRQVPCNDGGLALGQAAVAAARSLAGG